MTAIYRCSECGHLQYGPMHGDKVGGKIRMVCGGECRGLFGRKKKTVFAWYSWTEGKN